MAQYMFACEDHGHCNQIDPCCDRAINVRIDGGDTDALRTVADVVAWILEHTEVTTVTGAVDAALWFKAMHEAEYLREATTIKDMACTLMEGISPISLLSLQEWLDEEWREDKTDTDPDTDPDWFSAKEAIEDALEDHFGSRES